jgi:hypothetical protein
MPINSTFASASRNGFSASTGEVVPTLIGTFTTGGSTGRFGPSLDQARSGLSGPGTDAWKNNTSFFNTNQGRQLWTVQTTGSYRIEAYGARGGSNVPPETGGGGWGASMIGTFSLTAGQVIAILVGQQGLTKDAGCNTGGGGGTFVWVNNTNSLLIAAGGGGGAGNNTFGQDGQAGTDGGNIGASSTPGSGGNGASPGGSGWFSNGTAGLDNNNNDCRRPLEDGRGGAALPTISVGDGGFGGGAGASGQGCGNGGAGGGGGYSGGSGPSNNTTAVAGGGGGSFNSGSDQINTTGGNVNNNTGRVVISLLS